MMVLSKHGKKPAMRAQVVRLQVRDHSRFCKHQVTRAIALSTCFL